MPNGRPLIKPKPPPRTITNLNYKCVNNNNTKNSNHRTPPQQGGFIRHQPGVSKVDYTVKTPLNQQQPFLSSFKPQNQAILKSPLQNNGYLDNSNKSQVIIGPLVPGEIRHLEYNPYHEPNALVPVFQQNSSQQQSIRYQQQFLNAQKLQEQQIRLANPRAYRQQQPQLILTSHIQQPQFQKQAILNKQQEFIQQQIHQKQAYHNDQHISLGSKQKLDKGRPTDGPVSDEQWVDGPRVSKSKVAAGRSKADKPETWVDGPQVNAHLCYGFMDDHKKSMIEKWVEVQTAQVANELESNNQTSHHQASVQDCNSKKVGNETTPVPESNDATPFRTCEESTNDSDADTISEEPSGTAAPHGSEHPSLIEELERKNLIPISGETNETCKTIEEGTPGRPPESSADTEGETEGQCSPDEASAADEPSIEDICSQCEALAEECEELSSLLSCEEEECKRQVHQGLGKIFILSIF